MKKKEEEREREEGEKSLFKKLKNVHLDNLWVKDKITVQIKKY